MCGRACSRRPAYLEDDAASAAHQVDAVDAEDISHLKQEQMCSHTPGEKVKITAGAVTALVIVAWLAVVAFALLAAG